MSQWTITSRPMSNRTSESQKDKDIITYYSMQKLSPMCVINVELQGDYVDKLDHELIELGLEQFYQDNLHERVFRENMKAIRDETEAMANVVASTEKELQVTSRQAESLVKMVLTPKAVTVEDVEAVASAVPSWNAEQKYFTGDIVEYNGDLWIAIMGGIGVEPGTAMTAWQKYIESKEYLDAYGRTIEVDEVTTPKATASATDGNKPVATDIQSKE